MSIFSSSTFPLADNFVMWKNISVLCKLTNNCSCKINKNSNPFYNNIFPFLQYYNPSFLLSPDFCFWKKFKKNSPSEFFKISSREIFIRIFYCFQNYFLYSDIFPVTPRGRGPVTYSTAIITWCKLCASYYLFGAESLFNLAVLDCVKPDIDQVASVVYCMIEWKLKRRQIKLFEVTTQNTGRQTTQKFSSQEPRWNSSATTAISG